MRRPIHANVTAAGAAIASLTLAAALTACGPTVDTRQTRTTTPNSQQAANSTEERGPDGGLITRSRGLSINHGDWQRVGFAWEWSGYPFLSGGARIDELIPTDAGLISIGSGGFVSLLDPQTGRLDWSRRLGDRLTTFVGAPAVDDRIYISTDNELLITEAESGNLLDRQSFARVVSTSPIITPEAAIYGTLDGKLLAHEFGLGVRGWEYDVAGRVSADPIVVAGTIAAVGTRGEVLFVDPDSGSAVGRANISGGLANDPVTDGEALLLASLDQSVYAIEPAGRIAWRYRTEHPIRTQPFVAERVMAVTLEESGLTAFDAVSGEILWTMPELKGEVLTVLDGDEAMVWDGSTLTRIDFARGETIASATLAGVDNVIADSPTNGNLYVIARDVVARFRNR